MYLCFVDESGAHGGSPVFVVGGIIIHELDAWHLQQCLDHVSRGGQQQTGLIVHDRSNVEGTLQSWTNQWRVASSSLGPLRNLADVPMFADSRASRALQAADLVAYALYRYYSKPQGRNDERYVHRLWSQFHADNGRMHGLIHDSSYFKRCKCPACASRR